MMGHGPAPTSTSPVFFNRQAPPARVFGCVDLCLERYAFAPAKTPLRRPISRYSFSSTSAFSYSSVTVSASPTSRSLPLSSHAT